MGSRCVRAPAAVVTVRGGERGLRAHEGALDRATPGTLAFDPRSAAGAEAAAAPDSPHWLPARPRHRTMPVGPSGARGAGGRKSLTNRGVPVAAYRPFCDDNVLDLVALTS